MRQQVLNCGGESLSSTRHPVSSSPHDQTSPRSPATATKSDLGKGSAEAPEGGRGHVCAHTHRGHSRRLSLLSPLREDGFQGWENEGNEPLEKLSCRE